MQTIGLYVNTGAPTKQVDRKPELARTELATRDSPELPAAWQLAFLTYLFINVAANSRVGV